MKMPTGETLVQKMFVHLNLRYGNKEPFLMGCDMSSHGYTCLGEVEVSYVVPDCNVIEKAVESLEKQIEQERADSHLKIVALQEKIQNLLAIGHDKDEE